jgi:hypothetical protein
MLDESPWSLVGLYRRLLDADAAEIRIRGDSAPEAWDGVDEGVREAASTSSRRPAAGA